jgi:ABC-type polysaccharide/polyol phosphate transport system ATPase subunit
VSAAAEPFVPSVRLAGVSKRYVKYEDVPLLVTRLRLRAKNKRTHLWALRDIDLDVAPGETVGVIGRNGSGKSTMLRMLAGVTAPTSGVVTVKGRVAPLISVGVGFHAELTGRENVYVNGTILGMSRREIDRRFDDIVDFAEVADFIDTPVKFYSSGMFVRLGFSVAVASSPDILLVDEVLAVGDFAFQQKCFARIAEIQSEGTIVLVVSHNIAAIRRLCSRVLVLHYGEPRFLGGVEEGISLYHELLSPQHGSAADAGAHVEVTAARILGPDGKQTAHLTAGDDMLLELDATFRRDVEQATFSVNVRSENGQLVYSESTYQGGRRRFAAGETARFRARLPVRLPTGSYVVRLAVAWGDEVEQRFATSPMPFFVGGRPGAFGVADLGAQFSVEGGTPLTAPAVADDGHDPARNPAAE